MPDQDDLVFHKTCSLLQPFNVNSHALTRDTVITRDLDIDSVAVLDLIMELEDRYGISLPMNLISEIRTIGDLVEAIREQAGARQEHG